MKCVVCKGDDVNLKDVEDEMKIGHDIVFVPIKTLVCGTCGERYYSRQTIRYLEGVEQKLRDGNANLKEVGKVLEYS
jgi:YgiT-type zinc finger domain-containing protein